MTPPEPFRIRKNRIGALAALALALSLASPGADAAPKCSVGDAEAEKAGGIAAAVEAALRAAPDCDRAYATLAECQLGSSGDNALADIVVEKCEADFKPSAGAALLKSYQKAQRRCEKLAHDNSGSLYQSFAAVCLARAARDFSHKRSGTRRPTSPDDH